MLDRNMELLEGTATVERWIKGMLGRRLWWEMPVKESQAAMEAR